MFIARNISQITIYVFLLSSLQGESMGAWESSTIRWFAICLRILCPGDLTHTAQITEVILRQHRRNKVTLPQCNYNVCAVWVAFYPAWKLHEIILHLRKRGMTRDVGERECLLLRESQEKSASRFDFTFLRSGKIPPLVFAGDSNTRADLRIDFITKSCDNDP